MRGRRARRRYDAARWLARTDGAARAAAEPRGPAAGDHAAPHVRADPRDPRAVRAGERRLRQADVRAGQGPPARLRRPPGAGGHRRLGHASRATSSPRTSTTCRRSPSRPRSWARSWWPRRAGERTRSAEQAARKLLYGADGGVLAGLSGGPARVRLGRPQRPRPGVARRGATATGGSASATEPPRARSRDRTVDAFAMVFRGGHWYLVGHDRDRDDVRAFRLSRFTREITDDGEGATPPDGFKAADHVQAGPWAATGEDRARGGLRARRRVVGDGSLAGAEPDGDARRRLGGDRRPLRRRGALAALILQFGPEAEVREPDLRCGPRSSDGWRASVPERRRAATQDQRPPGPHAGRRALPGPAPGRAR